MRGAGDHRGIEVQGVDGAADAWRERDREGAVTAAEFGDVAGGGVGGEAEGVEDERDVEEGFPVILGGHAAFAEDHGIWTKAGMVSEVEAGRGAGRGEPADVSQKRLFA